jgi:hypothetical protein
MAQRGRPHTRAAERDWPKNAGKKTVGEHIADMVQWGGAPGSWQRVGNCRIAKWAEQRGCRDPFASVWTVSQTWRDYDRWFTGFRTASSVIAPAARLLVVQAPIPPETRRLSGVPEILANLQPALFLHMPSLGNRLRGVRCMHVHRLEDTRSCS